MTKAVINIQRISGDNTLEIVIHCKVLTRAIVVYEHLMGRKFMKTSRLQALLDANEIGPNC